MSHNPRDVDAIGEEESLAALKSAGQTITCSWTILTVHRKSTDDWETILIFFDRDHGRFHYAFSIETAEQLEILAQRLRKSAAVMRSLEKRP